MNRALKKVVAAGLSPVVRTMGYLKAATAIPAATTSIDVVHARAVETAADFISAHLSQTLLFSNREPMWSFAVREISLDGLNLEFGVFRGRSINHFARERPRLTFHGFDSFEGLSHDWFGTDMPSGTFDMKGKVPKVRPNVILHKGWFDNTLPRFMSENTECVAFLHLDADTEAVTSQILEGVGNRLRSGSILVFDEFFGFPSWETQGEYAAWMQFCEPRDIAYSFIAFGPRQAVIRIDDIALPSAT